MDEVLRRSPPSRDAHPPVAAKTDAGRFLYIDGLRGLAAMMVAVGHLAGAASDRHPGILGPGIMELADLGRYGVQIFFVLSGFVIAHSVARGDHSFAYLGRFAGRRFVRLDLPYWSVIALEMMLLWLSGKVMAGYSRDLPGAGQIASNAFYLQNFLGYEHILPVFWTLCYEVQFYFTLVLSLVLLRKLGNAGLHARTLHTIASVALTGSFCWSLAIFVGLLPMPHAGLFVDRWFQFALGVVTYLCYRGDLSLKPFTVAVALCIFAAAAFGANDYRIVAPLVTAATAVAILASLRFERWNATLAGPSMQFLGKISYSLYLIHLSVGWRAIVVIRELMGDRYSTAWAYAAFVTGTAASVLAAWVMYLIIEAPAVRIARKIRLPQRGTRADSRDVIASPAPAR